MVPTGTATILRIFETRSVSEGNRPTERRTSESLRVFALAHTSDILLATKSFTGSPRGVAIHDAERRATLRCRRN